MQIFCNVVMFLNLIADTVLFIVLLKKLPKDIEKIDLTQNKKNIEEGLYRFNQYFKKFAMITVKLLPAVAISILTCLLDGLSDGNLLGIPVLIVFVLPFVAFFVLPVYFHAVRKKYEINDYDHYSSKGSGVGSFSIIMGLEYAIVLSQSVYTIIILCH